VSVPDASAWRARITLPHAMNLSKALANGDRSQLKETKVATPVRSQTNSYQTSARDAS
jgi:hypothetical protein